MRKLDMVNIKDLTDFVLLYLKIEGIELTHLKLQKVLYYIQAWHLVFFDKHPLFIEEPEAWVNGPVYKSVYKRFKKYKDEPIEVQDSVDDLQKKLDKLELTDDQQDYLREVLNVYGSMPAAKLVYLTHCEEPWNKAREGFKSFEISSAPITHNSMYECYKRRLERNSRENE